MTLHAATARDFATWRQAARQLLAAHIPPANIAWQDGRTADTADLFATATPALPASPPVTLAVPKALLTLAASVACHREPARWDLLYRLAWRVTANHEKTLLGDAGDRLVRRLQLMHQAVGRDIHKMHAFVRFRKVQLEGQATYLAFHRPDHYVVHAASPFFHARFKIQRWGILTPDDSVCWDGQTLLFGAGMPATAAPAADELEHLWLTYYGAIFNPARIKTTMMKKEMPVRHWKTLPESALIADLLAAAPARVAQMLDTMTAAPSPGAQQRRNRQRALTNVE